MNFLQRELNESNAPGKNKKFRKFLNNLQRLACWININKPVLNINFRREMHTSDWQF